jgi:hypothetical protein
VSAPLSFVERALVGAARRAVRHYGTDWPANLAYPAHVRAERLAAAQCFLEAHGPEYAEARAWRRLMFGGVS